LTEFYSELSRGLLTVTGQVTPWVRTHLTLQQVTAGQAGFGEESRVLEYLWNALQQADPHVDFGAFDNDGPDGVPNSGDDDGVVDAVAFEFIEVSGSCGGPGIWPHRSAISWRTGGDPFTSTDPGPGGPIRVDAYIIQSVTECDGVAVQNANVIGHEMGHVLGLPDLYHPIDGIEPTTRRWVVGCWGLMAAGSWGCGDPSLRVEGYGPVHMSPWSLAQLGWTDFQEAGHDVRYQPYVVEPTGDGGRPLRIPLDPAGRESIVLEYRTREGFDRSLPGQGLLAYRWNLDGQFRPVRDSGVPYRFRLLEGDGNDDLIRTHENGGNRGELSDLLGFPGNETRLSATTQPSTRREDGSPSSLTIHRISLLPRGAAVWISTHPTPAVVPQDGSPPSARSPYIQFHRIGGGVPPYRLESTDLPGWLSVEVSDDLLLLTGVPTGEGTGSLSVALSDAEETRFTWDGEVVVGPFFLEIGRVADELLRDTSTLTALEVESLDELGNGNGRLDVGDLRTHLRTTGQGGPGS
ncbi:MAG: M6 family metalloprotease domain-containing protein, partial [Gemmatimonadetes bacterium]|nr:M6 family metalloprotease domain-containing protein [Gemmatimonadota bacterium]